MKEVQSLRDPKERDILTKYFGLAGEKERSFKEIGVDYGVVGERMRQVSIRALKNMRRRLLSFGREFREETLKAIASLELSAEEQKAKREASYRKTKEWIAKKKAESAKANELID